MTGAASPLTPFGFFFANPTTLYVADEGNATITGAKRQPGDVARFGSAQAAIVDSNIRIMLFGKLKLTKCARPENRVGLFCA